VIYLDSCLVIYALEPSEATEAVLSAMQGAAEPFAVSELVCMECLVGPLRSGNELARITFERFFTTVARVALAPDVFRAAASLRARHGLRTPDAVHVAAAQLGGCSAIWTNDRRLATAVGTYARSVLD
jgi:uncharacterized protein